MKAGGTSSGLRAIAEKYQCTLRLTPACCYDTIFGSRYWTIAVRDEVAATVFDINIWRSADEDDYVSYFFERHAPSFVYSRLFKAMKAWAGNNNALVADMLPITSWATVSHTVAETRSDLLTALWMEGGVTLGQTLLHVRPHLPENDTASIAFISFAERVARTYLTELASNHIH